MYHSELDVNSGGGCSGGRPGWVYGDFLYLLLNITVNLKLLSRIKSITNNTLKITYPKIMVLIQKQNERVEDYVLLRIRESGRC